MERTGAYESEYLNLCFHLHEFSTIITLDNIIWIVHGRLGDGVICRPKYVPLSDGNVSIFNRNYFRLSSPIFKRHSTLLIPLKKEMQETFDSLIGKYSFFCESMYPHLYIIPFDKIKKIVPNINNCENLSIGQAAHQLIEAFHSKQIPAVVSGSISLGSAIEDYSDINLIIPEKYIHSVLLNASHFPGVSTRSFADLRDFTRKYKVETEMPLYCYYENYNCMFQQFTFQGYSVSIFYSQDSMNYLNAPNNTAFLCHTHVSVVGSVKRINKYFLPFVFDFIAFDGRCFSVEVWDRAFFGWVNQGDIIRVEGNLYLNTILITPGKGRILRVQNRLGIFLGSRNFSESLSLIMPSFSRSVNKILLNLYASNPLYIKMKYGIESSDERLDKEIEEICSSFVQLGIKRKNIDILKWGEAVPDLNKYDAIYFHGGDIPTLHSRLVDSGLFRVLDSFNGIFIGYSAGAAILCNYYLQLLDSGNVLFGLGLGYFPNYNVYLHYDAEKEIPVDTSRLTQNHEFICLGKNNVAVINGSFLYGNAPLKLIELEAFSDYT